MRRGFLKKTISLLTLATLLTGTMYGCGSSSEEKSQKEKETQTSEGDKVVRKEISVKIDTSKKYQTLESFGASGCWWSQIVGGWSENDTDGVAYRDKIATLLYDREKGIGLTNYRYNIGGGSADSKDAGIADAWRRAESFETAPGVYDWSKDANAVWMMKKAKELGVEEIVFFANSPLERLTKSGHAYGNKAGEGETTSNLPKENYRAHAEYVMDVVEHFIKEGYPIKYVSPVNEPQWEWTGGQEGCHFEPDELVEFYNVFLDVMEERKLEGVELSMPELGEWGNTSYPYFEAILADERLKSELKVIDCHSYWSDTGAKTGLKNWLKEKGIEDIELKMSEWCQMENGKDTTMDSALVLSETVLEDLNKLSVTSWQYWIAVSCYNYKDGLLYVNKFNKSITETKRLWAFGNYSRFIRPGYERVDMEISGSSVKGTSFVGKNEDGLENLVIVLTNTMPMEYEIDMNSFGEYKVGSIYVTDETHSLEKTEDISNDTKKVVVPGMSVITITLTK